MDWVITVPKTVKWEDYQKELDSVAKGGYMSYRIGTCHMPIVPKVTRDDRCFVVWNGKVRGWMKALGIFDKPGFVCSTTGTPWPSGKYLVRAGEFHVVDGPLMKGFRGVRKYKGDL